MMAYCRGFVGESSTMASECAVLGVPGVFSAPSGRGYTDEQETRYGLVHNVREPTNSALDAALDWLLSRSQEGRASARSRLLREAVDVCDYASGIIREVAKSGLNRQVY